MTELDPQQRFAFVDVDHCLIATSSVTSFARYYFVDGPEPAGRDHFDRIAEQAGTLAAGGASRSEILVHYYRVWVGQPRSHVLASARRWHRAHRHLYHQPVVDCLQVHRTDGVRIVLVSASFRQVLLPIAAHVGAAAIACTGVPVDCAGVFTASTVDPLVGRRKAAVVSRVTASTSRRGLGDYAYGDHHSDLPILSAVDHPVVVGGDRELIAVAAQKNWTVLPGAVRSTV